MLRPMRFVYQMNRPLDNTLDGHVGPLTFTQRITMARQRRNVKKKIEWKWKLIDKLRKIMQLESFVRFVRVINCTCSLHTERSMHFPNNWKNAQPIVSTRWSQFFFPIDLSMEQTMQFVSIAETIHTQFSCVCVTVSVSIWHMTCRTMKLATEPHPIDTIFLELFNE